MPSTIYRAMSGLGSKNKQAHTLMRLGLRIKTKNTQNLWCCDMEQHVLLQVVVAGMTLATFDLLEEAVAYAIAIPGAQIFCA